jgi:hypothetical protein
MLLRARIAEDGKNKRQESYTFKINRYHNTVSE